MVTELSEHTEGHYITADEAADILGMHRKTMGHHLAAGRVVGAIKSNRETAGNYGGRLRWWIPTPVEVQPGKLYVAMPREDTTVEGMLRRGGFKDEGCAVAPKCLECPLEVCKFEGGAGWKAIKRNMSNRRNREIVARHNRTADQTVAATAAIYGLSGRSIHRILADGRAGNLARVPVPVPVMPGPEKYFRAPRPMPAIRPREVAV